jgi:uncharacterized protein (UPF0332 family)
VTSEAAGHFAKAYEYLTKARALMDVLDYADEAGRAAYLAGYHPAQALIYDRTGREAKTHKGVHSQFNGLVRSDPSFDDELRRFLAQAYDLKAIADYEFGPDAAVSSERVEAAIATAIRFGLASRALWRSGRDGAHSVGQAANVREENASPAAPQSDLGRVLINQ